MKTMTEKDRLQTSAENFEPYDYERAMREDIKEYLDENEITLTADNYEDIYEQLQLADSVTGNGSGSYWFNSYKAALALVGNCGLLADASEYFGGLSEKTLSSAESLDVIIRCYLLDQILPEFITRD